MEHINVLKSIGLAARARKVTFGSELTCEGIRAGRVVLALVCKDASEKTAKRVIKACEQFSVKYHILSCDTLELAHALGKAKPLAVAGITDKNLCVPILRSIIDLTEKNASLMTFSESEV